MTEDGFKQKFRSCRPESGETFQQFAVRLSSYFMRWIEMSKVPKTYEGLYDLMLRDQFLHVCNKEVMLFLKERTPGSIDEMTKLADQFKEARRVNVVTLTNQLQKGKTNSLKPNITRSSEPVKASNKPFSSGSTSRADRRCFKCNKTDHLISSCPMLKNKAGSTQNYDKGKRNRFENQQKGIQNEKEHEKVSDGNNTPVCGAFITLTDSIVTSQVKSPMDPSISKPNGNKEMPVVKSKFGEKDVTVLRDTGCNGVVIRKSLVNSSIISSEYQTCVLADGSSVQVPVAKVTIDTPYFKGDVVAWLMDKPLYDIIIGNIEGAREPNNPDTTYSVNIVTRQQARLREKPYPKLKVPDSIKHVSIQDIEHAQQSDPKLTKIRNYAKEEKIFEKDSGEKVYYKFKNNLLYREFQSPKVNDSNLRNFVS